ncbi:hypothetical protein DV515_00014674 [Chloebia gouldiae]|uniref:Uncharacterized protein n=1 Tax=Chloebia gouldiae TaxID=44316 RepID=A0A3L8RXR7_CHLGU|nr:hypothetical protein DV515_00014674 [Chloebia gouldiae]
MEREKRTVQRKMVSAMCMSMYVSATVWELLAILAPRLFTLEKESKSDGLFTEACPEMGNNASLEKK